MHRFPTWHPTTGCIRPSPTGGCAQCYAFRGAKGKGGTPAFHPKELRTPSAIKTPTTWRVSDHGDLFAPGIKDAQIEQVWDQMTLCDGQGKRPKHVFLVCTRHPVRAYDLLFGQSAQHYGPGDFAPNIWLGTSVTEEADIKLAEFLVSRFSQWHLFLMLSPLISPVPLSRLLDRNAFGARSGFRFVYAAGESGPHPRVCNPKAVDQARLDCEAAGVPFVFGGWGDAPSARQRKAPEGIGQPMPDVFKISWE